VWVGGGWPVACSVMAWAMRLDGEGSSACGTTGVYVSLVSKPSFKFMLP
jgi:hypothetical protein